jgi:hypothetical protein
MCGTENEASPNGARRANPASTPYQRVDEYLSNVSRYKIIESMEDS